MLVYHKLPMGYAVIDGHRIYGKCYAQGRFGPTNLPRSVYVKNKDVLEEMTITGEWLSKKFNKEFPSVSFKPSTMWQVDFPTVIDIARLVGIPFIGRRDIEYTDQQKRGLRNAILNRIYEDGNESY